jgi:IS5 family transposase
MLRIYFLQQSFNLWAPPLEKALYDSRAMRGFVGIDPGREPVPGDTKVCRFRHLLETHDLGQQPLTEVLRHLDRQRAEDRHRHDSRWLAFCQGKARRYTETIALRSHIRAAVCR